MVKTDISSDEMIGMSRYAYDLDHIFSFGLTTDCSNAARQRSYPACFLINPPREQFGGMAIMIPVGPSNDEWFYDYIHKFAFYVLHNQDYLIEDASIVIQNGIDKKYANQMKRKPDGHATAIASKLKKYAFNVINVENTSVQQSWAKKILTGTTVFIIGTGEYQKTIETLRNFVPIDNVIEPELGTGEFITMTTGAELVLVLGNSYLDRTAAWQFSYYK